jgi:hypothetical protein
MPGKQMAGERWGLWAVPLLGLLAVSYWGGLAALIAHRTRPAGEGLSASLVRPRPLPMPAPQWRGQWLPPRPAWAPFPRPRPLGLARGLPPVMTVEYGGR